MRRSNRLRASLFAAGAALAAAACDSPSATPPDAPHPLAGVRLDCGADVRAGTVTCAPPGLAGTRANRILGGQGVNVRTVTSGVAVNADTFAFDLAILNQLAEPIGTGNGTVDPGGVKAFFVDGVHTTLGTGSVSVANADGVGTFTATNQPYFAYPQIIAPEQVSAPKRWKLRFDAGVQQFAFSLLVSAAVPQGSGKVFISMKQPANGERVGDTVVVTARVDSLARNRSLGSVQAVVGTTVVPMVSQDLADPSARLVLTALPPGALTISVRATTLEGDTGVAAVSVFHATPPPVLTVASPLSGTVARPSVRIDADCLRCRVVLATVSSPSTAARVAVAQGTTSIHQDVSLAAFEGDHRLVLTLTAIDSADVAIRRKLEVPVESSARLGEVVSGGDRLIGFDATRLLVGSEDLIPAPYGTRSWHVRLRDRATGAETEVGSEVYDPDDEAVDYRGWRFSSGFVYSARNHWRSPFVWVDGVEVADSTAEVAGDWLVWLGSLEPWNPVRINLLTGAWESLEPYTDRYSRPQVADNGDVVWRDASSGIYRARVGQSPVALATGDSPLTDGVNVAYVEVSTNLRLKLYTADGQTLDLGAVAPNPGGCAGPPCSTYELVAAAYPVHTRFELRNGWLAFVRPDADSLRQVWTRSPAGEVRPATSPGSHAEIRALGRNGEVIFASGGSVYSVRYPYTAAAVRLFSDSPFYFLRWEGRPAPALPRAHRVRRELLNGSRTHSARLSVHSTS